MVIRRLFRTFLMLCAFVRFGAPTTVVFVAGIEGTGHHALHAALHAMPLFATDKKLTHALSVWWDPETTFAVEKRIRTSVITEFTRVQKQPRVSYVLLNDARESMLSFPYGPARVATRAPDLLALRDVVRELNMSLVVIELGRRMDEVLISTTKKRRFTSNVRLQTRILRLAQMDLTQQMHAFMGHNHVYINYNDMVTRPNETAGCLAKVLQYPNFLQFSGSFTKTIADHTRAANKRPTSSNTLTAQEHDYIERLFSFTVASTSMCALSE